MILASIKPYYYYLIAEEKKKIEVRKTALKNLPQDIAFYMSKDEKSFARIPKKFQEKYRKHFGKVGLKATCNGGIFMIPLGLRGFEESKETLNAMCLTNEDLNAYGGLKTLYGWHISDLKIYDIPKTLTEFYKYGAESLEKLFDTNGLCPYCIQTDNGEHKYDISSRWGMVSCEGRWCDEAYKEYLDVNFALTRPPQSWQYVDEVKEYDKDRTKTNKK